MIRIRIKGTDELLTGLKAGVYDIAANAILDKYAEIAPEVNNERDKIGFILDGDNLTVDESTMSPELINIINERSGEG